MMPGTILLTWQPAGEAHLVQLPVGGSQLLAQPRHIASPAFNVQKAPTGHGSNSVVLASHFTLQAWSIYSSQLAAKPYALPCVGTSLRFPCIAWPLPSEELSLRLINDLQKGKPLLKAAALLALVCQATLCIEELLFQQRQRSPVCSVHACNLALPLQHL